MRPSSRAWAKILLDKLPSPLNSAVLMRYRHWRSRSTHRDFFLVHRKLGGRWLGLGGPFAGMKHVRCGFGGCTINRLLGLYESELHESVDRLRRWRPDRIVNIGAAEGYYAVGLTNLMPNAAVIAFEGDEFARFLLRKAVAANDLAENVEIRGWCGISSLESALDGYSRPSLFVDCEGFEDELLDPIKVPALRHAAIIVELHDMFVPGVDETIRERFEKTHEIVEICSGFKRKCECAAAEVLTEREFSLIVEEHRGHEIMKWYSMWPSVTGE